MKKEIRALLVAVLMIVCCFGGVQATKAYKVYTTKTETEAETYYLDARTKEYDIRITELNWTENLSKSIGKKVAVEGSEVSVGETSTSQYVRVVITKKFEKDGASLNNSKNDLGSLIELTVNDAWTKDTAESTAEREVYYLTAGGSALKVVTPGSKYALVEGIRLNEEILDYVVDQYASERETEKVETVFGLDGATVVVKVEAEGIQVHNAAEAALDSWGLVPAIGFAPEVTD